MNRRDFIRKSFAGAALSRVALGAAARVTAGAALFGPLAAACGGARVRPDPRHLPVDRFLARGARVMWCAAHPDDECFSGALLARASIYYRNPLALVVLTHGEGGECCRPEGCRPDLGTVRGEEMRQVAARYRAQLYHERFWNAPLPVESFPKRHDLYAKWLAQKNPVPLVARIVRRFRPNLLLTFDPDVGATGHPEHQLSSRIATAAVRLAAQPDASLGGLAPHRVDRTYYVVNRFWLYRLLGRGDPAPVTEQFDATAPCTRTMSCVSYMTEATKLHRTQDRDMGNVRNLRSVFAKMDLHLVDPFRDIKLPTEPVA